MNRDYERMPAWNDEHTNVHHIILNDEFQPIFAFKWKIARQYERRFICGCILRVEMENFSLKTF